MRYSLNFSRPIDPLGARYQTNEGTPEFWDVQDIVFRDFPGAGGDRGWLPVRYEGWLPGRVEVRISIIRAGIHGNEDDRYNLEDKEANYSATGSLQPDTGFFDSHGLMLEDWEDPQDFIPVVRGDHKTPWAFVLIGDRADWIQHGASTHPGPDGSIVTSPFWTPASPKWACGSSGANYWPLITFSTGGIGGSAFGFEYPEDPRPRSGGVGGVIFDFDKGEWGLPEYSTSGDGKVTIHPLPDGSGENALKMTVDGSPAYCW